MRHEGYVWKCQKCGLDWTKITPGEPRICPLCRDRGVKSYRGREHEQGLLFGLSDTDFSPCRTWRYTLTRMWDKTKQPVMFVALNPSTADEVRNDPTVRRCMGYARFWGYGGLVMTNIFAFRATDPRVMKAAKDPVGPENDSWLQRKAETAGIVVAAWGTHGVYRGREDAVRLMFIQRKVRLMCLGKTKGGHPKHPLYLPKDAPLVPWP